MVYIGWLSYAMPSLFQQLIMVIKFPCKICNKAVASNHHAVQCDKCHIWVHIKCNKINLQTYKFLQKSPLAWYCIKYFEDIDIVTISNQELFKTNQGSKIKLTVLTKHHTPPSQDLTDQLNKAMDDPSSETVSSKYYEPCELLFLSNNSKNCLFFPFEYLFTTLISEHKLMFDIFGVSETKLRLNKAPLNSIIIPGYNFEFTANECSNGGTAIYIKKGLNYKLRKDLEIYKSKQLESTFVEVTPKNEKVVIGCIYIHPSIHGAFRIQ